MASSSQGVSIDEIIDKLIHENRVMIFSKSYCPYCHDAKDMLRNLNVAPFKAIELDHNPLGYAIQDALSKLTGQWTVPNIFINAKSIGGCDDLHVLHSTGRLQAMLTE